jgi:uncharacterized membrane protein
MFTEKVNQKISVGVDVWISVVFYSFNTHLCASEVLAEFYCPIFGYLIGVLEAVSSARVVSLSECGNHYYLRNDRRLYPFSSSRWKNYHHH